MTLMVRYCEKHRYAWPVSEKWDDGACPLGYRIAGDRMPPCPVSTVDAAAKLNELGQELDAAEEAEIDGG